MRSKQEIIKDIVDSGSNATLKMMGELLDFYIDESRVANDNATSAQLPVNQGAIQLGQKMKSDLGVG